jgi:hypothetical protein
MKKYDRNGQDELEQPLNAYGRHLRHLAEHVGTIPPQLDELALRVLRAAWVVEARCVGADPVARRRPVGRGGGPGAD